MAHAFIFDKALTSAQAREWAAAQSDHAASLIEVLALLRHFERASLLDYGEEAHAYILAHVQALNHSADANWARTIPDPLSELGEFIWVLNLFERAARLTYGTPPHANALDYAHARWQAARDMAGLEPLEPA
ncbi:MAG: hypothetical protein EB015_17750 [Methylocystaceae bacterium]|nr:hypothetical protein [Methylocystaceae bacterium]